MRQFTGLSVLSSPGLGLAARNAATIRTGTVEARLKAKGFSSRAPIPVYTTSYVHSTIAVAIDAAIVKTLGTRGKVLLTAQWNSAVTRIVALAKIYYMQTKKVQTGTR